MAPPRLVLRQQLETMIDYIDQNKSLSNSVVSHGICAQKEARHKWAILSKKLNAVPGGVLKTPECWRRYWTEWRYKVRRKAADIKRQGLNRKVLVPLDDLDMRVLEFCKKPLPIRDISHKQSGNSNMDESDTEQIVTKMEFKSTDKIFKEETSKTADSSRISVDSVNSPPPQWALDLEDRRIAAEERVACAIESIAALMQKQEERRVNLEKCIAVALTSLAGTMQELKNGMQEVVHILHNLQPTQPNNNGPPVENHFLIE